MTNKELQEKLKAFPGDWPVVAQDGLNPSDWCEINRLETRRGILEFETRGVISLCGDGAYLYENTSEDTGKHNNE